MTAVSRLAWLRRVRRLGKDPGGLTCALSPFEERIHV